MHLPTQCELCERDAAGTCPACGAAFCAGHAPQFCFRCAAAIGAANRPPEGPSTAVVSGDREPRPSGKGYLQCVSRGRPTIHVEDPGPPTCYRCQGLARRICQNCHGLYCQEHAGGHDLCDICARSARLGLIILVVVAVLLALFLLVGWLASRSVV
jgi:hypothetical protein